MLQFDISADVRNKFGKGAARSMRRAGQTPAVLYGPQTDALPIKLDTKTLTKTLIDLQRRNAVFNMDVNDGSKSTKRYVLVKEVQAEPVSGTLVHADFLEVKLEESMVFNVPVTYKGNAKGVELGGEMHIVLTTVKLKGLILDIPDSIEIDVSDLDIGDRLYCSDLTIPTGSELLNELTATCVSVVTAAKEVEEEEELDEEAAEGAEGAEGAATEEGAAEEKTE